MTTASKTATKPQTRSIKGAVVALCLLTAMNFVNYLDRYILPAVQGADQAAVSSFGQSDWVADAVVFCGVCAVVAGYRGGWATGFRVSR